MAAALAAGTAQAQDLVLSYDQARQLARELLAAGNVEDANRVATQLLAEVPNDGTALAIIAATAPALGDPVTGRKAGVRAYTVATTSDQRYEAARLTANAAATNRQFSLAQFWLRLARQSAPDDAARASVAQDYQLLRDLNPWNTSLSFGVRPSDNINNGSQGNTAFLQENVDAGLASLLAAFGFYDPETGLRLLGDNERALSGTELSFSFGTQYRLSATPTAATFLTLGANADFYRLSDEARTQAPGSKNGDFTRAGLNVGIVHRQIFSAGDAPTTFRATVGSTWYGGEPNTRYLAFSADQPFLLSERDRLTFGANVTLSRGASDDTITRRVGTTLDWRHITTSGNAVDAGIGLSKSLSDLQDSTYTSLSASVGYTFARPIGPVAVSTSLTWEVYDIGDTLYAPFDRIDHTLTARARFVLTEAELFGFQPVLTLSQRRNGSTVDQFDTRSFDVGVDLQSSF